MLYESLGAVWAVESMSHLDSSSMMVSESQGALWALESIRHS